MDVQKIQRIWTWYNHNNGLTVHIENRDGNTNVCFMQEETLNRMFLNLENNGLKVRRFRADCGSYTQKAVTCALEHAEFIYIRAQNFGSLYEKVKAVPTGRLLKLIMKSTKFDRYLLMLLKLSSIVV